MRSLSVFAVAALTCASLSWLPDAAGADPAKPAAPAEAAPVAPLPPEMLGVWAVDVEATLESHPDLAKMPPEAQAQVRAQSGQILGGLRFAFTPDGQATASMNGAPQKSGRYRVLSRTGDTVNIEMTDPDGQQHAMTLVLEGGRLRFSQGQQLLVLERSAPPSEGAAKPGEVPSAPAAPRGK